MVTQSGIQLELSSNSIQYTDGLDDLTSRLDHERGMLMSSGIEYPGRYTRWELGFVKNQ